jgi:protein-glutamine gamma-glutamyltransferase
MSPPGAHLGSVGRELVPEGAPVRAPAPPARPTTTARFATASHADQRWATWIQLAAFFALAAFAAGHWAALVESPSTGRTLLVVLVATAGGAALIALGAPSLRRLLTRRLGERPRAAGAVIVTTALLVGLGTIALGLGAAGLPLRLLGPANWGELADGLDRGLAGVQSVDWPYDGPEEWIRLTILLGTPLLLGLAALVAFFPARRGRAVLNALGLVLLLLAYGTAVTEQDPSAPLVRGLALLLLVAAWLWLPRLRPREAAAGAAAVMAMGLLSLPVAAALDADEAWWNYRAWDWFGSGKAITFDWTHQYGPLDWPREGTTLLNVRSDRPHYWKAETLDAFDGLRWFRSPQNDRTGVGTDLPKSFEASGRTWQLFEYNRRWDERIDVTVRSLTSDLVIGAGTVYRVDGVAHNIGGDGTARVQGEPLQKGDTYTVSTYAPNPTQHQMRVSSGGAYGYPGDFIQYTRIYLPDQSDDATEDTGRAEPSLGLRQPLYVPLRGEPLTGQSGADVVLRRSRYGDMYRLALDWTRGAETNYDRVKAIERNLQENYIYAERVPTRPIPLNGFLFDDRRGYCQQFSGTMALMLRMLGVPTRVAAGFSPGSYNRDTGEYRVRDLDAHSWVEVFFTGIGWVPFDPTPTASPAESQSAAAAASAASAGAGEISNPRGGVAAERVSPSANVAAGDDGAPDWVAPLLILLALSVLGGVGWYLVRRMRVRHGLTPEQRAEAQLAELRRALDRLEWRVPAATTLLGLERRLLRSAGPHSAGYARRLRQHRYDPRSPEAPGPSERRALRRELTARAGLRGRLRGLFAIPPGGPRPV